MATPRRKSISKILLLFSLGREKALAGANTLSIRGLFLFRRLDELGKEIGEEGNNNANQSAEAGIAKVVVAADHSAKHDDGDPKASHDEDATLVVLQPAAMLAKDWEKDEGSSESAMSAWEGIEEVFISVLNV